MRLVEIIVPDGDCGAFEGILGEEFVIDHWKTPGDDGKCLLKILVEIDDTDKLLKTLEAHIKESRVILYPVEGTLPRKEKEKKPEEERIKVGKFISISKEELYDDIDKPVDLSFNYILMLILSAFVAGIGILRNNVAIIIGAMVIAPFLGPNISMSFGTVLGDWSTIKKSILAGIVATVITVLISVLWGIISPDVSGITRDLNIDYQDILLALVCGFAGVITVLSGQGSMLVGVMVAAALLPPLMRAGLFLGGQYYLDALNSFLIFGTNIVCLNVAGIITFYLAGIRPNTWWEKEKAKKRTRIAFAIWTLIMLLIIALITVLNKLVFNI